MYKFILKVLSYFFIWLYYSYLCTREHVTLFVSSHLFNVHLYIYIVFFWRFTVMQACPIRSSLSWSRWEDEEKKVLFCYYHDYNIMCIVAHTYLCMEISILCVYLFSIRGFPLTEKRVSKSLNEWRNFFFSRWITILLSAAMHGSRQKKTRRQIKG